MPGEVRVGTDECLWVAGRRWDWRWGLEDDMLLTVGGIRKGLGWDESRTHG